jgi:hypothetical protein
MNEDQKALAGMAQHFAARALMVMAGLFGVVQFVKHGLAAVMFTALFILVLTLAKPTQNH